MLQERLSFERVRLNVLIRSAILNQSATKVSHVKRPLLKQNLCLKFCCSTETIVLALSSKGKKGRKKEERKEGGKEGMNKEKKHERKKESKDDIKAERKLNRKLFDKISSFNESKLTLTKTEQR